MARPRARSRCNAAQNPRPWGNRPRARRAWLQPRRSGSSSRRRRERDRDAQAAERRGRGGDVAAVRGGDAAADGETEAAAAVRAAPRTFDAIEALEELR